MGVTRKDWKGEPPQHTEESRECEPCHGTGMDLRLESVTATDFNWSLSWCVACSGTGRQPL